MSALLTRGLRVTVVQPTGVIGGAELWLLSMLDATSRLDADVLMLSDGPLRAELEARGVPVEVLPVGRRARDLAAGAAEVRARLRDRDPDVAVGNGVKAQLVLAPGAQLLGIPSVWVKHDHSHDSWLARPLARSATAVVATVEDVAEPTGRGDVTVIHPPRPVEPLARDDAARELDRLGVPAGDRLRLAMLGRLVPYKGIDTAIRALAEPGGADWELVVMGGDEPARPGERRRLGELADGLGVAGRVHLLGHVREAARLLPALDALAVLTRPDGPRTPGREGYGMAAVEAMLAGIPLVAGDDAGPVARRAAAGAGLLVDAEDPATLAVALHDLRDSGRRAALGETGRRQARALPTAAHGAARFVAVLCSAAHRPGAGLAEGPPLSVVSPVLNEIDNIPRLVTPIAAQLRPGDEFLLIDGGSTDGTVEQLQEWAARDSRIRIVHAPGGSIAASRNRGVTLARNDDIACTDAGCDPADGWLDGLRAALAEQDSADLFVGVYRVGVRRERLFEQAMAAVNWPDPDELRRPTPPRRAWGRLLGRRFLASRVDGRSVAFRRTAWSDAGGFPEHLRTAEDEAFGRAVLAAGHSAALTLDASVTWHQRPTIGAAFRQFRGYGRGGGASGSPLLLGRDLARALVYPAAALLLTRGGRAGRSGTLVAAATYLSLPVARLRRRGHSPAAFALLPVAVALKDGAKLLGAAEGLIESARARGRRGGVSC